MANPHAVLSQLDAPDCCDPALYVIGGRFRQMRRYLAFRPGEVPRVFGLVLLLLLVGLSVVQSTCSGSLLVSWIRLGLF